MTTAADIFFEECLLNALEQGHVAAHPHGQVHRCDRRAGPQRFERVLRMSEPRQRHLGQRVDADDFAAAPRRRFQRRHHPGMVRAGVLADHQDDVGAPEVFELDGPLPHPDRFPERDAARFVAEVRTVGEIVRAESAGEQLVEERRLVAGSAGGVEDRPRRGFPARRARAPPGRRRRPRGWGDSAARPAATTSARSDALGHRASGRCGRRARRGCGVRRRRDRRGRDRSPRPMPWRRSRTIRWATARRPAARARHTLDSRTRPAGSCARPRGRPAEGQDRRAGGRSKPGRPPFPRRRLVARPRRPGPCRPGWRRGRPHRQWQTLRHFRQRPSINPAIPRCAGPA